MRVITWLACLTWAAHCTAARASGLAADWCLLDHEERVGFYNKKLTVYNCPSASPLLLIPFLWSPVKINIQCPTPRNAVYVAPDMPSLLSATKNKDAAWCGWEGLMDRRVCRLQLSAFTHTMLGVEADQGCRVTSEASPDYLMLISGLGGLVLFYAAPALSSSIVFRLSCGSALFTAGSLLVLLIFTFRFIPHKRTVTAVMAATGSGGMAILRWLTGKWIPPLSQLLRSRAFGAYVLVSAASGAAATYLYDDRSNPKVNTLIKASLRVFGLALVYFSTWTFWPFSACCMGVMVASISGPGVVRGVQQTSQHAHNALKSASKFMRTPFQGRTPRTRAHARPPPGVPPTTAPPTPRVVDFDSSADGLPSPFAPAKLTPLHLRTPPPEPWVVQPKRRVSTFKETMVKSLLQRGGRGRRGRGATSQGGGTSSVTPLAGDDEFEAFEGVQQQQVSPMVKSGFLLNPLSGRPIKIGGDTYNRLLEEGYRPDVGAGVLLLPLAEEEEGVGQVFQRGGGAAGSTEGRSGPRLRASSNSQRQQQAGEDSAEPEASFGSTKRPPRFQW